jgi:hypothetical protein
MSPLRRFRFEVAFLRGTTLVRWGMMRAFFLVDIFELVVVFLIESSLGIGGFFC